MNDDMVLIEAPSQTRSRTARTAVQTGLGGALVTVGLWAAGAEPPVEVVAALVAITSSVCALVQNVWEATIGRRLFERPLRSL